MKSILLLLLLGLIILAAVFYRQAASPIQLASSLQVVASPIPVSTATPPRTLTATPSPTPARIKQRAQPAAIKSAPSLRVKVVLTRGVSTSPSFAATIVSSNLPTASPIAFKIDTLKFPGPPLAKETFLAPAQSSVVGGLADNWQVLLADDFESDFPVTPCALPDRDATDAPRSWALDSRRVWGGAHAISAAHGGGNGQPSAGQNYDPNSNSWLVCGPFDQSYARDLLTQFALWEDIADAKDFFGWGISTNGEDFTVLEWQGPLADWVQYDIWANGWSGQPRVWLALIFNSDSDAAASKGVWVDDLRVSRYKSPALTCGDRDAGRKGVHLPPYEKVSGAWYPIIRSGDTLALDGLVSANAQWVRLGIRPADPSSTFAVEQEYDRMVDSLCAAGIGVLGLLNHETVTRPLTDLDDPLKAGSYRQEFMNSVWWYASHFKDRITYWEIWNEPNLPVLSMNPRRYAALLTETYRSVGAANPQARVLSGGLGSGWNDSNAYLDQVYSDLDSQHGRARPFDIFAVHLYFDDKRPLDPAVYLHAADQMELGRGDKTIVDKFIRTMNKYGDLGKRIWVTELGWNSARGLPNAPPLAVTGAVQALYLKSGFDILFSEAPSVDKIFWYQYQDVFTPAPGFWGLYGIDKRTPKPAQCAFAAWPQSCP